MCVCVYFVCFSATQHNCADDWQSLNTSPKRSFQKQTFQNLCKQIFMDINWVQWWNNKLIIILKKISRSVKFHCFKQQLWFSNSDSRQTDSIAGTKRRWNSAVITHRSTVRHAWQKTLWQYVYTSNYSQLQSTVSTHSAYCRNTSAWLLMKLSSQWK